jgi:plasmid stabilization system protein ParE
MGKCLIIWKNLPLERIRQVADYLIEEYSTSVAEKFLDKLAAKIDRIADYPESGQRTRFKTVRRIRVDKYHNIYYRQHGQKIFILYFWDGRQEPRSNIYG